MTDRRAFLALNGKMQGTPADYMCLVKPDMVRIAADGGALLLEKANLKPDIIIGDLDSLTEGKVATYRERGTEIIRHPVEKDETDAELALDLCRERGLDNVVVTGTLGGRFDQQLANVFLLENARRLGLTVVIREPGLKAGLVEKKQVFSGLAGAGLSLLPLSRTVSGVSITGCKYTVENVTLKRWKTRGISNLITSGRAEVHSGEGLLLYIIRGDF